MLSLTIPKTELFNESDNTFMVVEETRLTLEHSLISISKWEAKWQKPYLSKDPKTAEQCLDYIRCMTLNTKIDPRVYLALKVEHFEAINSYVESPMSATTFREMPGAKKGGNQIVTSELLYYYMIAFNIPFECQKWHLNRLLTLIKICDIKNQPKKKMSRGEILAQNTELNKARRAAMKSRG